VAELLAVALAVSVPCTVWSLVVADATTNVCGESTAFISAVKTDKDDLGVLEMN